MGADIQTDIDAGGGRGRDRGRDRGRIKGRHEGRHWVATLSRLLKIIGLFCKRAL